MRITKHFKCLNCGQYNEVIKPQRLRKYCDRSCRDAAYYKRKSG